MADGTKIVEPVTSTTTTLTTVDTHEVDFGGGDVRDRQRFLLAGTDPNSDVGVTNTAPAADAVGVVTRDPDTALRWGGGKTAYAAVLSSAGAHTVVTPAAGHHLRVSWVAFVPNSDNSAANLVQVGFQDAATPLYIGYAMAHWEPFVGLADKSIIVTTATSEPVSVMVHYEELS